MGEELVGDLAASGSTRRTRRSSGSTTTSERRLRSAAPSSSICASGSRRPSRTSGSFAGISRKGAPGSTRRSSWPSGTSFPAELHAQLLRKLATLEWRQGDFDPAGEHAEAALPLLADEIDETERWRLLILLGCIEYSRRRSASAEAWWGQSVDLARSLGDGAPLSLSLANLAVVLFERQDYRGAATIYEESVDVARRAEHREYLANALMGLGDAQVRLGEIDAGRDRLLESLALYANLGFHDRVASNCVWLAPAFVHEGDDGSAARLLGAAAGIRQRTGASLDWQEQEYRDELIERLRRSGADGSFESAFAAGQAAPDDVVREVLSGSRFPAQLSSAQAGLSHELPSCAAGARTASAARLAKQTAVVSATRARCVRRSICDLPFGMQRASTTPLKVGSRSA